MFFCSFILCQSVSNFSLGYTSILVFDLTSNKKFRTYSISCKDCELDVPTPV